MRGTLLVLLFAAGCDEDGRHSVIVRVADGDRAARVDVSVVRACAELRDMRNRPEDAVASVTVRGQRGEALGDIRAGQYGLHARAVDESCVVFAADCDTISVSAETSEPFEIYISGRPERYECGPGEACSAGECVEIGDPVPDGGVERDAGGDDPPDAGGSDGGSGDDDGDERPDEDDNCPLDYNPDQADADRDGLGDACDDAYGPCEEDAQDCEACVMCSDSQTCQQYVATCQADPASDCAEFLECFVACVQDDMCIASCMKDHPDGYAAYVDYYLCTVCEGCPNRCANDLGNQQECFADPGGG
jgi:hypothetical protein